MDFKVLKDAVNAQFTNMVTNDHLFVTNVTKDELWAMYLGSFPAGTNPIFRKRSKHDCQCCKQFIRACGNVVTITPKLELESIWDVEIGGHYQVVADALSKLVKGRAVQDLFLHEQKRLGTDLNRELVSGKIVKWEHFHFKLPSKFVNKLDIGTALSKYRAGAEVFQRGLETISKESIEIVQDLIGQGSIYRGEEMLVAINSFYSLMKDAFEIGLIEQDTIAGKIETYAWLNASKPGARIRNTAIGTLLIDVSEGMDLARAVFRFNNKIMSPESYKRPTAVISQGMIKKAQEKIEELGYMASLGRRNATMDDLTINNVLFADRSTKKAMNVFEEMTEEVSVNVRKLDKIEEVDINTFIATILPRATNVWALLGNALEGNLMSLVAPQDADAPGMFKWGNNFSWAYKGAVADSLKEQVKSLGGKVDGVARFSLIWNMKGQDQGIDFDAHCNEPKGGKHIYYENQGVKHPSTGRLDVDNTHPGGKPGIENIAYSDIRKIKNGKHVLRVHNYSSRTSKEGFIAELEINGEVHVFEYPKPLKRKEFVTVAEVDFDADTGQFKILKSLASTVSSKDLWNLKTQQFQKVSMIMNSPNHWDGEQTGNRHHFFILEGCNSNLPVRGFFNEFLDEKLTEHRKVFEILGSKMQTEPTDQLSGIGFSSTQRNSLICKVEGSFSRTVRVKF
ncbi:MAG: hypothetical protein GY797_38750 [Deltaproteobacteria bacterium]|nr:hypothetical protein [Deltaproteobacteria bacterium]